MSTDNLRVWSRVEKTDAKYVRTVNKNGMKQTTPNPQYQLKRMTELFGPVGQGWGYTAETVFTGDFAAPETKPCVICSVTVWIHTPENKFGPITGLNEMYQPRRSGPPVFDEDAPKKALTDALTKALSHLGMSADIYMGKYDDPEYVRGLENESRATPPVDAMIKGAGGPARAHSLVEPSKKKADFWTRETLAIPIPINADGSETDWAEWARRLSAAAGSAPSPAQLERLLDDNGSAIDRLGRSDPVTYNLLTMNIVQARNRFVPESEQDVPF